MSQREGLGASHHLAGGVGVQRFGGVHAEVVDGGEHPVHGLVAAETTVEEDVDEAGVVLGDAGVVHEQRGDGGFARMGYREQVVVADEGADPARGDAEVFGDLVDGEGVGSVRQGGVRGQR